MLTYSVYAAHVMAPVAGIIDIGESSFATVDFTLSNVTSWDGGCMNYGSDGGSTPDLKLWSGDQTSVPGLTWAQHTPAVSITGTIIGPQFTNGATITLKVRVRDAGAYGWLSGVPTNSELEYDDRSVTIPFDDNGNKIADKWEDGANYDPAADDEVGPGGNGNTGDWLSVFAEYRGFVVSATWTRTSPEEKDVFINSNVQDVYGTLGYGDAGLLPAPFVPHLIGTAEYKNTNRAVSYRGVDVPGYEWQKTLLVREEPTTGHSIFGETLSWLLGTDVPRSVTRIDIMVREIRKNIFPTLEADIFDVPEDVEMIMKVIAHEVGHGVNLDHCAASDCGMNPPASRFKSGYTDGSHTHNAEYDLIWRVW
ncbi:hypothetical protein CMK11_18670 [Candidatus Poribacteria bacterium]|nr:hypothetical protein [Candidatus Poribacteria bacterium]